ncbi:C40 family peptidase [Neolewinella persica]|uniref:C40 family peptidase n=1 Tax=Neolewinella persica TaxID=70998 RepID=UPI0003A83040|nr:C40 family peptidase [Neolewinella persica]
MRQLILLLHLVALVLVAGSCKDKTKAKSFEQLADNLKTHFVSDSRVDRFEIQHKSGFNGLYLEGYTTIPAAYDSLQATLANGFVVAGDNFRLLPDEVVGAQTAGIIKVSVANLRSKPGHSQELATQALLGTPIQVLDFQDGWYLVRTPARYLAWLEPGAFVRMTPEEAKLWLNSDLRVFDAKSGEVLQSPNEELTPNIISTIVLGSLVKFSKTGTGAYDEIELPDGTIGHLLSADLADPKAWLKTETLEVDLLLGVARNLAGRPYLWGGNSANALDCSGFTKTAYYLNGFVTPRDASQQVHAGTEVELTPDFSNLLPGDLLFFGGYRDNGSEKITHVGFYTGNGRFLHSGADNGRIMEQSFLPEDPDFAPHRLESLMHARRLSPGTPGVVPVGEAFGRVLE